MCQASYDTVPGRWLDVLQIGVDGCQSDIVSCQILPTTVHGSRQIRLKTMQPLLTHLTHLEKHHGTILEDCFKPARPEAHATSMEG